MDSFTKKEQMVILILVLGVILSLGFKFIEKYDPKPEDKINTSEENQLLDDFERTVDSIDENLGNVVIDSKIMVHISGQVYDPGIYEMTNGDRVNDVVNLAGGLTKNADLDRINLAKKISDEEKIYIPKIGEDINKDIESQAINYSSTTLGNLSSNNNDGKININMCSKSELTSLPGIGDVIADRIIEYRTSNKFKNIEEIMNVSGIGDKKYEGIKELIKVN